MDDEPLPTEGPLVLLICPDAFKSGTIDLPTRPQVASAKPTMTGILTAALAGDPPARKLGHPPPRDLSNGCFESGLGTDVLRL